MRPPVRLYEGGTPFANLDIPIPARPGKGKSAPRDEGPRGGAGAAKAAFHGCGSDEPGPQPLA